MKTILQLFMWALAGWAIIVPLRAQISYVGDITLPEPHNPILPGNGIFSSDFGSQFLVTTSSAYVHVPSTSDYGVYFPVYPAGVKLIAPGSLIAYSGASSPDVYMLGALDHLYDLNSDTSAMTAYTLSFTPNSNTINTLAANGTNLVLATGNQIYSLTLSLTGSVDGVGSATSTLLVSSSANGGPLGTLGDGSFGPNGLFYVLDQVNGVTSLQSYNPGSGLAGNSFTLASGTPLAAGMSISSSGHVYIGDGSGGIDEYLLDGTFLGDFTFTGSGTADNNGSAFVSLDTSGDIFAYDPNTGMHEYYDASAVPEPPTFDLLLLFGSAVLGRAAVRKLRWHQVI